MFKLVLAGFGCTRITQILVSPSNLLHIFKMPYRRKYRKRKRSYRRRPRKMTLSRYIDPEMKYADQQKNGVVLLGTPAFWNINQMGEGVAVGTRVGRQIKCLSVLFRINWQAFLPAPGADPLIPSPPTTVRVMMVLWKQSNGQGISTNTILEDPFNPLVSPLKLENNKAIRVLYDRTSYTDGTWKRQANVKHYVSFKTPILTRYGGTGTGAGAIQTNALFLMIITDKPVAEQPTYNGYVRLRYVG